MARREPGHRLQPHAARDVSAVRARRALAGVHADAAPRRGGVWRSGLRVQSVPHRAPRASRAARRVRHAGGARGAAPVPRHPAAACGWSSSPRRWWSRRSAPATTSLFFSVVLGLWMLWFLRWRDRRLAIAIAVASACAVAARRADRRRLPAHPCALRARAHVPRDRQAFSADVTLVRDRVTADGAVGLDLVGSTAPNASCFRALTIARCSRSPARWPRGAGAETRRSIPHRRGCGSPAWRSRSSLVAMRVLVVGPWRVAIGPVRASVRDAPSSR